MMESKVPVKPLQVRDVHMLARKLRHPVVTINWSICNDTVALSGTVDGFIVLVTKAMLNG
jgi:hypothetical protein